MPVPSPRNPPLAVALLGRGVVDPEQPLLHADDAGVLRGRAAFETMRVYEGVPFRLDAHLERLPAAPPALWGPGPATAGGGARGTGAAAALGTDAVREAGRPGATLRVVWTAGREGSNRGTGFALVTPLPDG